MAHALDRMLVGRRRSWAGALVGIAVALACAGGGAPAAVAAEDLCASPDVTNFLAADATRPGVIDLIFFHGEDSTVTYFECIGARIHRLGAVGRPSANPAVLSDATTWSCVRLERHFVAVSYRPDGSRSIGSYGVRTGSCAQRFELRTPRRVAAGSRIDVRVADRWAIGGIHPELCVTPPHDRRTCRPLGFARAVASARRSFRAKTRGEWLVELRVRGHTLRRAVAVGGEPSKAQAPPPTVLATGDSMMQGIDSFLGDDLGDAARVTSDVRPGTGISKGTEWLDWASQQAKRLRPAVTVIAIGANDGLPMPAVGECCGAAWIAEYTERVRGMMRSYARNGRGRVIWLTLPAPRPGPHDLPFAAVNRAIIAAGAGMSNVTVLRIDQIFTPTGYRDVMRYRGRDVRVREPDGIHLNISGTAIAATAVAKLIDAPAR